MEAEGFKTFVNFDAKSWFSRCKFYDFWSSEPWIRMQIQNWIRISIEQMRIHNTVYSCVFDPDSVGSLNCS